MHLCRKFALARFVAIALLFAPLLHAVPSWAEEAAAQCIADYLVQALNPIPFFQGDVDIGSHVHVIPTAKGSQPFDATFLGRSVSVDGREYYSFFKDGSSTEIYTVTTPGQSVRFEGVDGQEILNHRLRTEPASLNQTGSTCAAYAVFNCLRQINIYGNKGNGSLSSALSNEEGRVKLLVDLVDQLYIKGDSGVSKSDEVIRVKASAFGFQVHAFDYSSSDFKQKLLGDLKLGWPVIFRFNTSPESKSVETPYQIIELSQNGVSPYKRSLQQPRTDDESEVQGAHMIIATGYFEHNGQNYVLVLDSNYRHPRLWNVELFDRAESAHMRGWTIWEKK